MYIFHDGYRRRMAVRLLLAVAFVRELRKGNASSICISFFFVYSSSLDSIVPPLSSVSAGLAGLSGGLEPEDGISDLSMTRNRFAGFGETGLDGGRFPGSCAGSETEWTDAACFAAAEACLAALARSPISRTSITLAKEVKVATNCGAIVLRSPCQRHQYSIALHRQQKVAGPLPQGLACQGDLRGTYVLAFAASKEGLSFSKWYCPS
jgi:hypothetical protein